MKKISLSAFILLICSQAYADCSTSDGINLCVTEAGAGAVQILTNKKQAGDVNGDGFLDVVKVETAGSISNRLVIYLGKDCYGNGSLCFRPPHLTSVYPVTGIELKDLNNDAKDDVIIRDGQDKIRAFTFSEDPFVPTTPPQIIGLLGTNNLIPANYTASSNYPDPVAGEYEPAGAFDGYRFSGTAPIPGVSPPGGRYGLGTWTSNIGSVTNQWLKIQFSAPTKINGFDLYGKSGFINRLPKDIIIQTSLDGVTFVNHEELSVQNLASQTVTFANATPYTTYLRIFMKNTQSSADVMQVDEILLKGWLTP